MGECPIPVAKWMRPWPADEPEQIKWLVEVETAARQSGRNAHIADYCRSYWLGMAAATQNKEILRLRAKLTEKINMPVEELADRVFATLTARIEGEVRKRVEAEVKQIELRFQRQAAYEDAQMKRIGELAQNIDGLERRLAELQQATL